MTTEVDDPDYPGETIPIKLFIRIETARITDAINTLIVDINAALASITAGGTPDIGSYTVADLPVSAVVGTRAYASNGRKIGEGAGDGTGVPVYYSDGTWRSALDSPVLA
jgi:hypothetical protein